MSRDRTIYADPACRFCGGMGMRPIPDAACKTCTGRGHDADGYTCDCATGYTHCDCHQNQKIRVMVRRAGIPAKYIPCTIREYKPEEPGEIAARRAIVQWVKEYPMPLGAKNGLFLYGAPGTGKTHLACGICNALIREKDVQPLYTSATELMAKAYARMDKRNDESDRPHPFDAPRYAEVLVIDDLGAEKPSEYALSLFQELIDYRYRQGLPTIYTSNLDIDGIERLYTGRVERLYEACQFLHCDGTSRRRRVVDVPRDSR